jgi:hypothetical protein
MGRVLVGFKDSVHGIRMSSRELIKVPSKSKITALNFIL